MEYSPTGLKLLLLDSQLLHCVTVQDIDAAAAIYQDSGETSCQPLFCEGGMYDLGIRARGGHHLRVVGPAPTDGILRPMHKLWSI